jgi:hypothetical protein
LVDPAKGDVSLRAGSPAIDRGVTIAAIQSDKVGTSRPQGAAYDIGAYEYSGGGASTPTSTTLDTTTGSGATSMPGTTTTTTDTTTTTIATSTKSRGRWWRRR